MTTEQRFVAVVVTGPGEARRFAVPFDPDQVWGVKPRHLVSGTIDGRGWRGEIERVDGEPVLRPGPAWYRDNPLPDGEVQVMISPEGPQRDDLDPDVAAALADAPTAAAFFDGLAQFYRKAYLTWIAGASRRPDERARRVAELVRLLESGTKQRPR